MNKEFSYSYGDYYHKDKFARMRFDIVFSILTEFMNEGVKVLDIGCYDGAMLEILKKGTEKIDYIGVDGDELALEIAQLKGARVMNINFEFEKLPFEHNYFDMVIMGEMLEHLRDPSQLMTQAKDMVKPNGVVLISLPNECTVYHRFKMLLGKGIDGMGFQPGYHMHFPTLQQNKEFVSRYFKIIKEEYWYHLGVGGFAEKIIDKIPAKVIKFLVKTWPALFARGVIYLCQK